jgi:hypothetical protein
VAASSVGGKLDLVVMSVSSPLAFEIACRECVAGLQPVSVGSRTGLSPIPAGKRFGAFREISGCRGERRGKMINFPNLNSATRWRAGLLRLLAWVLTGALDGATLVEILEVPLIVAAWLSALLLIDRWVMQGTTLRRRAR